VVNDVRTNPNEHGDRESQQRGGDGEASDPVDPGVPEHALAEDRDDDLHPGRLEDERSDEAPIESPHHARQSRYVAGWIDP
jgi:hypothetical protein